GLDQRHGGVGVVHGRGRGEDDVLHAVIAHGVEQKRALLHVHLVVEIGLLDRLPHQRLGREVDHAIDLLGPERLVQRGAIAEIPAMKVSAPARAAMAAVPASTPPSTPRRQSRLPWSMTWRTAAIRWGDPGRKGCPPFPGSTVITSARSHSGSTRR